MAAHPRIALLLHDIRSEYNVGAMFRTADGAGVEKVYLSGYTPAPRDRFDRPVGTIAKTALGAEVSVPWEVVPDPLVLLTRLRGEGWMVVALEQDGRSIPCTAFSPTGPILLVVGNEVGGVPEEILGVSDVVMEIPMHGKKESLNVSVACGVALYGLAFGRAR